MLLLPCPGPMLSGCDRLFAVRDAIAPCGKKPGFYQIYDFYPRLKKETRFLIPPPDRPSKKPGFY